MSRSPASGQRRSMAGWLVLVMVTGTVVAGLAATPWGSALQWLATLGGWTAGCLLFADISRAQRIQVTVMAATGVTLLVIAAGQGSGPDWHALANANIGLLSMVTAVGFLRLVALPEGEAVEALPVGRRAYLGTLLGTGLLGSVINISAAILIADRLDHHRPLGRFASQSITRVFTGCASWSPFFAGMAVVLTHVSGARLPLLMLAGLPFAAMGMLLVYGEARLRYRSEVEQFAGYPLRLSSLWIPALLAVCVFSGSWLLPQVSILVLIALSAMAVCVITLLLRGGIAATGGALSQHVVQRLPRTANELVLFLAAGVLAGGISAMISGGLWTSPFVRFDAGAAVVLLALIVGVAAAGIHPLVLISGFTPMIMTTNPDPNLLALTYLFAWSLGTAASPLSGTHLVFQGRYGIPSWKAAIWNWPFVLVMLLFGSAWLVLVNNLLPLNLQGQ